jgi:hypothetical protein
MKLANYAPSFAFAFALASGGMASAATLITIGTSTDGGATIVDRASGVDSAGVLGLSVGTFDLNQITASFGPLPNVLDSTSLNAKRNVGGADMIDVFVTIQGLTADMIYGGFKSSFTENVLSNGWTVEQYTYLDNGNVKYGMATTLGSFMFTSIGTNVQYAAINPGATFSLTERYHVVASSVGSASSTIDISTNAAVPEPTTWAMLIAGFAMLGGALRHRRRTDVTDLARLS